MKRIERRERRYIHECEKDAWNGWDCIGLLLLIITISACRNSIVRPSYMEVII